MALRHNKLCEIEDFDEPELRSVLDEVFAHEYATFPDEWPHGVPDTKQWECAMACRALRDFGALHEDAVILGVGAGTEITTFYLANHARLVVATDRYLHPGTWEDAAPSLMLARPERFSPMSFDRNRLIVEHMDGRRLRFPDGMFDGIYSSGSIEHFGSLDHVANGAFEMGRVLRPGGVLTLSTEFKLAGPPGEDGWDSDTLIFSRERIQRYIIEASGLEPVDELRTEVSPRTMECERDLETFLKGAREALDWKAKVASYPNLVLVHGGYVFTSIHLVLRKSDPYPRAENAWARPSPATDAAIRRDDDALERSRFSTSAAHAPAVVASTSLPPGVEHDLAVFENHHSGASTSRVARRLPRPFASAYRSYLRVRYLAPVWAAQLSLLRGFASRLTDQHQELASLQGEIDALDRGLGDRILDATGELRMAHSDLERRNVELRRADDRLEAEVRDLTSLEAEVRGLRSTVRLLEYIARQRRGLQPPNGRSGADLVSVIRETEQLVPELETTSAVDISIASDHAEAAMLEVCAYFGDRLAGSGYEYRMPNDAWIYLDLDGSSFDASFEENAVRKVQPGGFLVLVGNSADWEPSERLEAILDTRIAAPGDVGEVQVRVLKAQPNRASASA